MGHVEELLKPIDSNLDYNERGLPTADARGFLGSIAVLLTNEKIAGKLMSKYDKWRAGVREKKANKAHTGFDRVGLAEMKGVSARPDSADPITEVFPAVAEAHDDTMAEVMDTAVEQAHRALGVTATTYTIPSPRLAVENPTPHYIARHASRGPGQHRLNEDVDTAIIPRIEDDDDSRELVGSSRGQ